MATHILEKPISITDVRKIAEEDYGTMIKGTVDIFKNIVAIGGDYHMETCELLVEKGSNHNNVWGFNIRFDDGDEASLEFDSLVNIKPALGNKSRSVENPEIIKRYGERLQEKVKTEFSKELMIEKTKELYLNK